MSADAPPGHVSDELLLDYFEQRLTELLRVRVEEHLADCNQCLDRSQKVRSFSEVWGQWTAKVHVAALRAASHPTKEDLLDYLEERLPERQRARIEEHIADCADCAAEAAKVRRFSDAWDQWTAVAHKEALVQKEIRKLTELLRRYLAALRAVLTARFASVRGVNEKWIEDCLASFLVPDKMKGLLGKLKQIRGRFFDCVKGELHDHALGLLPAEGKNSVVSGPASGGTSERGPVDPEDVEWARCTVAEAHQRMKRECEQTGQQMAQAAFERLHFEQPGDKTEAPAETAEFLSNRFGRRVDIPELLRLQDSANRLFNKHVSEVNMEFAGFSPQGKTELGEETVKQVLPRWRHTPEPGE